MSQKGKNAIDIDIDEVLSLTNGLGENNSEIFHDCEHEEEGWSGPGGRDFEREAAF